MWLTGLKWQLEKGADRTGQRDVRRRALGRKRLKGTIFIAGKKEKGSAKGAKPPYKSLKIAWFQNKMRIHNIK